MFHRKKMTQHNNMATIKNAKKRKKKFRENHFILIVFFTVVGLRTQSLRNEFLKFLPTNAGGVER